VSGAWRVDGGGWRDRDGCVRERVNGRVRSRFKRGLCAAPVPLLEAPSCPDPFALSNGPPCPDPVPGWRGLRAPIRSPCRRGLRAPIRSPCPSGPSCPICSPGTAILRASIGSPDGAGFYKSCASRCVRANDNSSARGCVFIVFSAMVLPENTLCRDPLRTRCAQTVR
jgi:hypothetical protein